MAQGHVTNGRKLGIDGFAQGGLYDAVRPRYPHDAVEHFVSVFALDAESHVLDLGAGTGIFTRQLLPLVGRVTAVEPSESMRTTFVRETTGVEILDGTDVAIPLTDDAVSAVVVAQAFHWFNAPVALREIHRVLRPGGGLGLIWNERDSDVAWVRDLNHAMLWDVRQPYDSRVDYAAVVAAGPFRDVLPATFHHTRTLTHEHVRQLVTTTSYITLMAPAERAALVEEVSSILAGREDPVQMPYVTNVVTAFARPDL